MVLTKNQYRQAAKLLSDGAIGVLPTDTVYGIHCLALNKELVEEVYALKHRDTSKPFIVLIPNIKALKLFGVSADRKILRKYWPGPFSIVLPCIAPEFAYLHRGKNSIAFRMPKKRALRKLLTTTGPLISTSVNTEGQPQIETIEEAIHTFGDQLAFYLDEGQLSAKPSTVMDLTDHIFRL